MTASTAARLGLTAQNLDSALYSSFGQSEVSIIYTQLNQYYVVLEVAPKILGDAGRSERHLPDGTERRPHSRSPPSPKPRPGSIPLSINHTGPVPSVTLSFNLAPGLSLSDATKASRTCRPGWARRPRCEVLSRARCRPISKSLSSEPLLILTALVAVYIVLGVLYESLIHPITIISTLPSASVGAMLALMLFDEDLNVISIIGIILLIGIVKKNAIMMIDFALQAERNEGKGPADAIFEACMLRFRPILMTTMAALFGALPLALGTGTGSELRRPLGISIVGGLIVSQLLTLYTTPVLYLAFDRLRLRMQGKQHDVFHHGEPVPNPA